MIAVVGREAELTAADAALVAVADGGSRVLGVVGEAGIGKSVLLAEVGERARAKSWMVLEGRGAEHERDVPFGLVADALDDVVADARLELLGEERLAALARVLPTLAGIISPSAG